MTHTIVSIIQRLCAKVIMYTIFLLIFAGNSPSHRFPLDSQSARQCGGARPDRPQRKDGQRKQEVSGTVNESIITAPRAYYTPPCRWFPFVGLCIQPRGSRIHHLRRHERAELLLALQSGAGISRSRAAHWSVSICRVVLWGKNFRTDS